MFRILTVISMIFILPLTALDNSENQLDSNKQPFSYDQIRVEINRDGNIFLNGTITDLSSLRNFFDEAPKSPDDSVLIVADEEVSQEDVIKVLDICCNYKYNKIRLVYQPVYSSKS